MPEKRRMTPGTRLVLTIVIGALILAATGSRYTRLFNPPPWSSQPAPPATSTQATDE
jgi:hypothetical protein